MITQSDEELLDKAKILLSGAKLSGAAIEVLEDILEDGLEDHITKLGRLQREKIAELSILHQIL